MKKLLCILLCSVILTFTACVNTNQDMLRTSAKEHINSYVYNIYSSENIVSTEIIVEEISHTSSYTLIITGTVSIITIENSTPSDLSFQITAEEKSENEYIFTDTEVYSAN